MLQELPLPDITVFVDPGKSEHTIDHLMPFTSYQVNVTAIPHDETMRPPARITVTTAMAAPKPMVKPDSLGSQNGKDITVILPQASEEFGPISHYFLAVVPEEMGTVFTKRAFCLVDSRPPRCFAATKNSDHFSLEELSSTRMDQLGPYIAAKFSRRTMPNTFVLGDGIKYGGFVNRPLLKKQNYQIFVRAVVDTPQRVNCLLAVRGICLINCSARRACTRVRRSRIH